MRVDLFDFDLPEENIALRPVTPREAAKLLVVQPGTDAPWLNKQYSVWGQVIEGMENIDKIKRGEPVRDPDTIVSFKVAADVAA